MRFLPLIMIGLLSLVLAFSVLKKEKPVDAFASPLVGKPLPAIVIDGRDVAQMVQGEATVINFFASWCAPCRLEQPELMALARRDNVPVVGIAWKNSQEDAAAFLEKHGNPFRFWLSDVEGKSTVPFALTGVPETLVVNAKGIVVYHTKQSLNRSLVKEEILPLIERINP